MTFLASKRATPRNHGIGLSARAVDPDLGNHGFQGAKIHPYRDIKLDLSINQWMKDDKAWFSVHQTVHSTVN